ncbi:unnamed protein product, partial [Polarella glacialis]
IMEYGPLEPYQGRHPERVYLQGEVRSDGFSLVLESATASLKQSDVLIALLTSDETFELKAVDDCFPPEIMTEAQAADACLDSSHPVFNSLFSHRRCCEKAQAAETHAAGRALDLDYDRLHQAAGRLIPRYDISEADWDARRLRWRQGQHPPAGSSCGWEAWPAEPATEELDPADAWLRRPYEILLRAGNATRQVLQIGLNDGLDSLRKVLGAWAWKVQEAFVTPDNIWSYARHLGDLDLVLVDIALLAFETDTMVPPPFMFSRGYRADWAGLSLPDSTLFPQDRSYQLATASCSLSHAVKNLGLRGYDLLTWGYDAVFFRRDLRPIYESATGQKYPLDEFECYRKGEAWVVGEHLRLRSVREWFFNANDPADVQHTRDFILQNFSWLSEQEGMFGLPFRLDV